MQCTRAKAQVRAVITNSEKSGDVPIRIPTSHFSFILHNKAYENVEEANTRYKCYKQEFQLQALKT